jgi:small subunit ribosomal protein S15
LIKTEKTKIIETFKRHEGDTGSTEIQVAILTERINRLTRHMASSKHDFNTQRGLLKLVGQRRRLLNYLSKENVDRYHQVLGKLGLRK